jgi:DNA-binding NarL/FixJ family response regulator
MNMADTYAPINIILADDHELIRDGFTVLINKIPDINLIAEASNGEELINLIRQHKPDVVVTDIKMPILDGIEATRRISEEFPEIGVIALSMFDETSLIMEMFEAGARGFLLKNAQKEEIVEAIKTVNRGDNYYCRETSVKMARLLAERVKKPHKADEHELTETETVIVKLICQELSTKEIAEKLFVSTRTIDGHRINILKKTNSTNTAGIVVYAIRNKLFE